MRLHRSGILGFTILALTAGCSNETVISDSAVMSQNPSSVQASPAGTAVFNNTPALLPPNMPSLGYQANQTGSSATTSRWRAPIGTHGARRWT